MSRFSARVVFTVALATLLGVVPAAPATRAAAEGLALPDGFRFVDRPTGQAPYNLTDFFWLDGGGLMTSGKDGTVTFVPPEGPPRVLATVPQVRATGDHGMLGFAPANDYPTSGRVYVTFDEGDPATTGYGMVEVWRASPALDPTTFTFEQTVIDGSTTVPQLAQTGQTHGIDSVVVAPDDTLFISVGDDSANNGDPNTLRAQDLGQPYGKVLRVDSTGAGVPTNPFYDASKPSSWRSRVYAYGFRNPFRISLDPRSGRPLVGDVGWRTWEEVDTVRPGDNAGWPCYEGNARTTFASAPVCQGLYAAGTHRPPTWTYKHDGIGGAVVGGFLYAGSSYPETYQGAYFFGDYVRGTVHSLQADAAGALTRAPEAGGFATEAGGPVAFHPGPNGDVTYADLVSGDVRRLVYSSGNRAPVARVRFTATDPEARTVSFSATDSYDLDRDQVTYQWDLGDGTTATGAEVEHTYADDTAEQVTLTVRDQLGVEGTASVTVHPANHTPVLDLEVPADRTYAVGEAVELSATAVDQEDGPLTVRWDTALLHCPFTGSCHLHPDATRDGADYTEGYTDHGTDTTMLVTARAEDSHGAVATRSYTARPRLRTLSVESPVTVVVDGTAADTVELVAGSQVELRAPLVSSYWRFDRWGHGGAATQSLTMPDEDLALTAVYGTAIAVKHAALGGDEGSLGAPAGPERDIAGGRVRTYAAGRILWSAATRAREVHGPVLTKYLREGGPTSLGFPTTDQRAVPGGVASAFTGGRIYRSAATGTHVLRGSVLAKFLAAGGPARLGLPTTDVTAVRGGWFAHLGSRRSIFASPRTGAHLLHGRIRARYAAMGDQRSCLGFPRTDVLPVDGGRRALFERGRITLRTSTGAVAARCTS